MLSWICFGRSTVMDVPSLWPLSSSGRPCCPDPAGRCSTTVTSWTRCTPQGISTGAFMSAAVVTWCTVTAGRDFTRLLWWKNEELCVLASILVWMSQDESTCVHCVGVSVTLFCLCYLHCLADGERGKEWMFTPNALPYFPHLTRVQNADLQSLHFVPSQAASKLYVFQSLI